MAGHSPAAWWSRNKLPGPKLDFHVPRRHRGQRSGDECQELEDLEELRCWRLWVHFFLGHLGFFLGLTHLSPVFAASTARCDPLNTPGRNRIPANLCFSWPLDSDKMTKRQIQRVLQHQRIFMAITRPEKKHLSAKAWVLSRLSAVKTQVFTVGFHEKSIESDLQSGCQEPWHTYQAVDWLGSRVVLLEIGHAPDRNLCRIVENQNEAKYKSNYVDSTGGVIFSVRASAVDAHCIDIQACPANGICHIIHCSETLCDLVGFLWTHLCSMIIYSTRYLRWRSVGSQVCQTCV